jgi:hypothetical protein
MAMMRMDPVPVGVRADWFDGRPREVRWGDERLHVTGVSAVRDERSAYPADTGPRTVFEVETANARLALSFTHRTRTWTLEGLDQAA